MKTLLIDIETSPLLVDAWGIWQQNVGINQIHKPTRMICFAAKWLGESDTMFWSEYADRGEMIAAAHDLLNDADVLVHFNGRKFDVRHINRELLLGGYRPPAPYAQIDLLTVAKKHFLFPSNKLAYISQALGLGSKISHEGHGLWTQCLAGDPDAWARMEAYNRQDVVLLEPLYQRLLPWITNHPNMRLTDNPEGCPSCGSLELRREGFALTATGKYQRWSCKGCGAWSKSGRREEGTDIRGVA